MKTICQKSIIVFIATLVAISAAASGSTLTVSCAPRVCSCSIVNTTGMPRAQHDAMQVKHNCAPTTPAPCCRLKPVQSKTELAISARPELSIYHAIIILLASDDVLAEMQYFAGMSATTANDRIRAPLVPLYLMNLAILC